MKTCYIRNGWLFGCFLHLVHYVTTTSALIHAYLYILFENGFLNHLYSYIEKAVKLIYTETIIDVLLHS